MKLTDPQQRHPGGGRRGVLSEVDYALRKGPVSDLFLNAESFLERFVQTMITRKHIILIIALVMIVLLLLLCRFMDGRTFQPEERVPERTQAETTLPAETTTAPVTEPETQPTETTEETTEPETEPTETTAPKRPSTYRPSTEEPVYNYPVPTTPPATQPPATQPPATQPPATQPPASQPDAPKDDWGLGEF